MVSAADISSLFGYQSSGSQIALPKAAATPEAAEKAGKEFESLFIGQMLEQMFGDSSGEEAFGDSETNDIYKGLMMEQYGKLISNAGGIGIASYVKAELLKQQEVV